MKKTLPLILFSLCVSALGLTGGDPVRDPTVVTFFRSGQPVGMGVWISPHHILTVSSLNLAHRAQDLRIHRGERWEGNVAAVLEKVTAAAVFGPLYRPGEDSPLESPMIVRSDTPSSAWAPLPEPNQEPGERTGNQTHLPVLGLGKDGDKTWKARGSVAMGSWQKGIRPPGRFSFNVKENAVELNAWDRGAPLLEDRRVVGLLGERLRNGKIPFYWVGEPRVLAWTKETMTTLVAVPKTMPNSGFGDPTRIQSTEPSVPNPRDEAIDWLP